MHSFGSFSSGDVFSLFEIALRLVVAAGLAALLGWDREEKDRPAGIRTYMLVALAAALFTVLTFEIHKAVVATNMGGSSDPIRIIEAVTAGVAFLAAGTIIQGRNSVVGLTTGAGMWMAGALGVSVGAGYYSIAVFAALLSFIILRYVKFATAPAKKPVLIEEDAEDGGSG